MAKNLINNLEKYSDADTTEKFKTKPNKNVKNKHVKTKDKHKNPEID